jgi:DNA modification methylase
MSRNLKAGALSPNKENPRSISGGKEKMLARSLAEFGDLGAVVFNRRSKQLVGGHQRIKVFPKDSEIEIVTTFKKPTKTGTVAEGFLRAFGERFPYREVDWDASREKAANIAANKGAGEWDFPALSKWLSELSADDFDLDLTMFDESERQALLSVETVEGKTDEDAIPAAPAKAKTVRGDVYQLGRHRLLCGDSTMIDDVEKLMAGEKADICFTSPPYNLGDNAKLRGYNGSGKDSAYEERTDHKTEQEYLDFCVSFTNNALIVSDTVFVNIQLLAGNKFVLPEYWRTFANRTIDVFIWDKEHAPPQMAARVLNSVWEFVFVFCNAERPSRAMKHGPSFRGTVDNIFRMNPAGKKDKHAHNHGAVFPVQFAEHFVSKFSDKLVFDPFGGSGSTLIAAEKTGRAARLIEISPNYCDVIVKRWEDFTGKKAKLISSA